MKKVVGIRFKEAGKIYYFDPCNFSINKNDNVIVETSRGIEYGNVAIEPREVEESKLVSSLKPVLRIADNMDDYIHEENKKKVEEFIKLLIKKNIFHKPNFISLIHNLLFGNSPFMYASYV